jgi:four helix bundle protein
MKKDNIIQNKSFDFAIKVVSVYKFLIENKKEYVLSKQFLKSGTSIGANVEEAIGGQSQADFISKLNIAYKEARECVYWIKLLYATEYISEKQHVSLINDADEICKILGKIVLTMKEKK